MESIATFIVLMWAGAGLIVPLMLIAKYGNPAWTNQQRILMALAIYIVGGGLLFLVSTLLFGTVGT